MKLNLGCGKNFIKGWVNLDKDEYEGVDIIHDLNKLPLPFKDNYFDYILCNNLLEHVKYLPLMNDLHRILKFGGILRFRVPHFTSKSNYADPTHINRFSSDTMRYFVKDFKFSYERDVKLFRRLILRIVLEKSNVSVLKFLYRRLENWINKSKRHQRFYERSFLRIFPALSIEGFFVK